MYFLAKERDKPGRGFSRHQLRRSLFAQPLVQIGMVNRVVN